MEAITPAQWLRASALGFLSGVGAFSFFSSFWSVDPLVIASIAIVVFVSTFVIHKSYRVVFLFVALFFFGVARMLLSFPDVVPTIDGEGIVREVRSSRFGASDLIVQTSDTRVLLTQVRGRFAYGDVVRVICAPELIKDRRGGALDFSFATRGVFFACSKSRITLVDHDRGNVVMTALLRGREGLQRIARQYFSEPSAALFSGIILGIDDDIPQSIERAFIATGLVHILVVSGTHMVLLGDYLGLLFYFFGFYPRTRGILTLAVLFLFVAALGFQASALRGFWFATLLVVARVLGRGRVMASAIFGTAALMIALNPFLIRDLGFQLSFLATIGVAIVGPRLNRIGERWWESLVAMRGLPPFVKQRTPSWTLEVIVFPLLRFVRETLCSTLGAIIITTPLIATTFGRVSLVAPLANLLIIGWMQPLMIFGIIFFLTAWIAPIAILLASLITGMLTIILWITEYLARVPYSQITVARSSLFAIVGYFFIYLWMHKKKQSGASGARGA